MRALIQYFYLKMYFFVTSLLLMALLTSDVTGQETSPGNLTITGYDSIQIYIDGFQVRLLPNTDNGNLSDVISLDPLTRLLAVRGIAVDSFCAGMIASVTNDYFLSGASWKCEPTGATGWFTLGFNDDLWRAAHEIGPHGNVAGCTNLELIPGVSPNAMWVWTNNYNDFIKDEVVYCRAYFPACDEQPCENGGTCLQNDNNICLCSPGFIGTYCGTNANDCFPQPCMNGGSCEDGINGYTCQCKYGFTGLQCETDTTQCASSPCQNGGTCNDDGSGFECSCRPGYTGVRCETNIDECDAELCQNGASCEDLVADYFCHCLAGYSGRNCETDINECESDPCLHLGTCNDLVNSYSCTCHPGHTGVNCETGIDGCSSEPCLNDGLCVSTGPGIYQCYCGIFYTGIDCETLMDNCYSEPCTNGGTCINIPDSFTCLCLDYYTGTLCQTVIPDCGSLSHVATGYPPTNGFHVMCYIDSVNDAALVNTPCKDLLVDIPPLGYNSSSIMAEGGNFGCYTTTTTPNSNACVDNYSQNRTLASCTTCTVLTICVRFPSSVPIF